MCPFQRIFRFLHGYWSKGTPQDEKEPLEDEPSFDEPEYALQNESDEETQLLMRQKVKYQQWLSRLGTGPFYPGKLFLRNVTPGISKELLMNFLENVTGQEDIETLYCDRPGDVLATFKTGVDFVKVKQKCERKLLNERHLEVWRVPVSSSIFVENLSSDTDPDHVSCYFQTPRAKGGTVLEVQPLQDKQKCVVCFEDANVVGDVLKVTHRLGGRELRVSLYVECLGPSGGRREPYVFVPPAPVELTDEDDLKIAFLRYNSEMLQMFNLYLSEVHANATVVGNVLTVSCTLTGSMHRVDLLVEKWRDDVNKQLQQCFDFIRHQRLEVQPEIWWDVRNAIIQSELNTDDLVLSHADECAFAVLDRSFDEGDTFEHIQSIASVKQKELDSHKPKVSAVKKLKIYQLDLLMLSTFFSDAQLYHRDLKVGITLGKVEVVFHGPLMTIREAQLKMYDILQSASSTVVTDVPDVHVSLLATDEARDAVNKRLMQARLAATWECCGNVVIVYSLHQTALLQAVKLIKTSFKSECISLDEVSSSLQTTSEWKDTVQKLVRKHCGLLSINTHLNTIFLTAFCDLMPTVKENIRKFFSESSIYSAAFQLSPSRLKFVTLFWEDKLSRITEKLKRYKINITLQSAGVLVTGTKQGIDLVRKELTSLSEQIVCTEELIARKETIRCLSRLWNNNELEAIACTCKCVLSHHPENVSVQMMITTNLPAEGHRVYAVQGDITQLTVDVIVNAANERMDHAGGLAGHIVLKGGDEIQKECYRILRTRGKLSEGDVLVSGPGKLPCKSIIHAVGPRYKGGNNGEEECLRDTVMECLKTASDLGYTSIALPAISSGIFGYPVREATRVIVQAVKLFFETNRDSSIKDVQLADILIETVQEFKKALNATYSNYTPITKQGPLALQGLTGEENSSMTANVFAIKGDITELAVDVIVNAANERMSHDGGLAGHIVKKGGDKIQDECYRILRTRGKLSEGDVLVSGPGKLPCKSIIHAVGPRYKGGNNGEEECLRHTVMQCLQTASDLGYTSIALPAISSGIFGYPVKEATRVIVQAVKLFFETNRDSSIKDVQLADILIDTVQEFKKALNATYSNYTPITKQAPLPLQGLTGEENSSMTANVFAIQEDITELAVDVVVNAANERMSHDGGLAGHIVKKGGDKIQAECYSILRTRGKLSEGDVLVSGPGKLPCKSIIHAVGPVYRGGTRREEECLRGTVLKCLETASALGYFSIALPAISSGIFGYPVEEATRVIVQAVRFFLDANHDSSIQVVILCDILTKTVRDFEKALGETARKGERSAGSFPRSSQTATFLFSENEPPSSQAAYPSQPRGRQNVTTSVNIADKAMVQSTGSAVQIAPQISTQGVKDLDFGGIYVTIKQGDITTEQVDAIVNSSNSQLDLSRGAVSCALKTKCGQAFENECKAKVSEITQRKVVTTAAFNLRCKHIVHIDTSHYVNNNKLTTAYMDILKEADNLGLNSIALPAIGTGNLNISPSKSARAMGKALVAHSRIRTFVGSVTVVLFDANMMEEITVNLTAVAAAQGFVQSTSSGSPIAFKRLYLPENGEVGEGTSRPKNNPLPKVLKLYIFASQYKRADFLKALDGLVKNKFVQQEIKDFDKVPLDKRKELCRKYELELCQTNTGARVKGMVDDIQMLKEEIINIINKAERQQQECMIANLVQWYYFKVTTTGTKRIPYEKRENLLIENAYQKNQDTVELTDSEGTVYVVSFKDMTDSVKMCPTDSVQITRKEIIADLANSESLLPETWEPLSNDESVKRVTLVKGCPEYQSVKASMSKTAGTAFTIKSIERIQNPDLYKQYVAKKTQMDRQNNGMQAEKTLWHGTSSDAIENINLYGFNRSFCGKNATYYGQGVYFAVNSNYSMSDTYSVRDQSGRKHMYQCKVLVGYPTVGTSGMKVLPPRHGKIRYDSATDNNLSPNMYIIFSDTQAYPEYLITFNN